VGDVGGDIFDRAKISFVNVENVVDDFFPLKKYLFLQTLTALFCLKYRCKSALAQRNRTTAPNAFSATRSAYTYHRWLDPEWLTYLDNSCLKQVHHFLHFGLRFLWLAITRWGNWCFFSFTRFDGLHFGKLGFQKRILCGK